MWRALWPQSTGPGPQLCLPRQYSGTNPTHQVHQLPRASGMGGQHLQNPPSSGTSLRAQKGCSPLWEGLGTQPPRTTFCLWENEVPSKGPPTNFNEDRGEPFPRPPEHLLYAGAPLAGRPGSPRPQRCPGPPRAAAPLRSGPGLARRSRFPKVMREAGARGTHPQRRRGPRPPRPGRARPLPAPAPPFQPRAALAPAPAPAAANKAAGPQGGNPGPGGGRRAAGGRGLTGRRVRRERGPSRAAASGARRSASPRAGRPGPGWRPRRALLGRASRAAGPGARARPPAGSSGLRWLRCCAGPAARPPRSVPPARPLSAPRPPRPAARPHPPPPLGAPPPRAERGRGAGSGSAQRAALGAGDRCAPPRGLSPGHVLSGLGFPVCPVSPHFSAQFCPDPVKGAGLGRILGFCLLRAEVGLGCRLV